MTGKISYCDLSILKNDKKMQETLHKNPHTAGFFCDFEHSRYGDAKTAPTKLVVSAKIFGEEKKMGTKNEDAFKLTADQYYADPNNYTRILTKDFPKMKYDGDHFKFHTTIHWGQRKLLMSEIEFLTLYGTENSLVIYPGSAPGRHIAVLAEFFPKLRFILIDPRDFDPILKNYADRIQLINAYFDKDLAKKIKTEHAEKPILLISDIRTGLDVGKSSVREEDVLDDMKLQKHFYKILEPDWTIFKFRVPFNVKSIKYYEGTIFLQVWARHQSSETRLVVGKNAKERLYTLKEYEDQLYYFNRVVRNQYHQNPFPVELEGIQDRIRYMDHCYDCVSEFYILYNYWKKSTHGQTPPAKSILDLVVETAEKITKILTGITGKNPLQHLSYTIKL